MKLESGDIVLFYTALKWYDPRTWPAAIIRLALRYPYNHVGIVVKNWGVPFINEALGRGVVTSPAEVKLHGRYYKVLRPTNAFSENILCVLANSKLGVGKYDYASLLIYHVLQLVTGKWYGKQDHARLTCSEYVGWVLDFDTYWTLTPKDIATHPELREVC